MYKKLFSRPYSVIQKAMNFEWDSEKSDQNLAERGFGFDFAVLIFEGVTLEKEDRRKNYGEKRIQAIGGADEFVLFVVYTDRENARRIISARLAEDHEAQAWERKLKSRPRR